ncbi:MAG: type I polyketide synthase [Kibdelosporangium sp.]
MRNGTTNEPIAIVGMASRLPGAPGLAAFWDMLMRGGDAITGDIPEHMRDNDWDRLRKTLDNPGAGRLGSFLDKPDEFDAAFFGVPPRDALRMSPVQRILMETVWEAIDDAGVRADQLAGSRTAVFTSCSLNPEYWDLLIKHGVDDMSGLFGSVLEGAVAGRIAYTLDLRGPNMAVDATCAGSLMALHLACRSIRYGESETAIVGSATLQLDAMYTNALAQGRIISPTGACRFGDTSADGYVRTDGALAVLLKPLDAALADGDRIYATVLGTGTSSAGRGASMIAPSAPGQAAAIRAALADAHLQPSDLDYVEAHGTGTFEGDRAELTALGDVLAGPRDQPCLIGSVKSNFGHAEFASGLVGVVKTALAMWHGTIPQTLHVQQPNQIFADPDLPLRLVRSPEPWPARGSRKHAGISSFGASGSNVHVVLGGAPQVEPAAEVASPEMLVLPVSARASRAVSDLAQSYVKQLETAEQGLDTCFSAGVRRTHHQYRVAVVGADPHELADGLREFASGAASTHVAVGKRTVRRAPRVAFVFPGQGSQWAGMGRELFAANQAFRERMLECEDAVCAELGWSVIHRLTGGKPLSDSEVQPVLWAVQVSLAAVWQSWGVRPDVLIGHSMGEIAAATVSGALSVRDAATVVCRRNALLDEVRGHGTMLSVHLGEDEAVAAIGPYAGRVSVAVLNSPYSTVLAGDAEALEAVAGPLRARGVHCRWVDVEFASHTAQVDPLLDRFAESLAGIRARAGSVPIHSTVTDTEISGAEMDAGYWAANLRKPVRFAAAVQDVLDRTGATVFVEVSPHPVLAAAIESFGGDVVGSLVRDGSAARAMAVNLANAYVLGCTVDWEALNPGGRYVALPSYPWQRKRFWPGVAAAPTPKVVPRTKPETTFLTVLADLLGMPAGEIDVSAPLPALGMDSVLVVALRGRIKQALGVEVPVHELLSARTVAELDLEVGR